MKYIDLSIQDRQDIPRRVQSETGKDPQIVEKDWWVVTVLRAFFELPYASHISFKGGHSICRNATLQRLFIAIGRGEHMGSGADVIAKGWKDNGWPSPELKEHFGPNDDRVELTLRLGAGVVEKRVDDKESDKVNDNVNDKVDSP